MKMREYKINEKEATSYYILEQKENETLLMRDTKSDISDPTPFIVATGLQIKENNTIEWSSGKYCSNFKNATDEYFKVKKEYKSPDETLTGERIYTPRGCFSITTLTEEEMLDQNYGFHHNSPDGKYAIMGNGIKAYAIENVQESTPQQQNEVFEYGDNILNDNISIDEHIGTWYVIDTQEYNGEKLYLLEHEEYGDEAPGLIVNADKKILLDDVWNGFDDYDEKLACDAVILPPIENRSR